MLRVGKERERNASVLVHIVTKVTMYEHKSAEMSGRPSSPHVRALEDDATAVGVTACFDSTSSNGFFSLMALRFLHGVLIPLQRLSVLHLCRNSVREHSLDHIH